jgi:NitT/TauT family transport system permease protein
VSLAASEARRATNRGRRASRAAAGWVAPALTFVALLALWHLATLVFGWEVWLVPSPVDVGRALWEFRDLLPEHTWVTLVECLAGFLLAVAVGVPLAVLIAYSRFLERTIYPVLLALNAVPKIAIAPILILWMGFGYGPKVAVSMLLCVFPIVISTATGLKSTPPELVELARSLCVSEWDMFRRFRFPAALPEIFVGLEIAISLAVIGAVIGEFVGASQGLGWVITNSGANVNTSLAFAAMVLLSVLSVVLFYGLVALERWLVPWARRSEG